MNKKGFTLPEMLGVIVILGVILTITLPIIDGLIMKTRNSAYDTEIKNIENAAKSWALKNADLLPETEGNSVTVFVGELKHMGELGVNLKNPVTKKIISNNSNVEIINSDGDYEYKVNIIDVDGTEVDVDNVISMEGKVIDYVEVNTANTEYKIPKVSARTVSGEDIPDSNVNYQIVHGDTVVSKINTNKLDEYVINYSVTYNDKTNTYKKMVVIRDTTKPELSVGDNLIVKDISSLSLLNGVSVTDNSGETIIPSMRSSISTLPGFYYVYYTAKDSSNNEITKRRQVQVIPNFDNGAAVYFNPIKGKLCTDYQEKNSYRGVKEGCMKWYVFNYDDGNYVNLLLDHNITQVVDYNSTGSSLNGPNELLVALKDDTKAWKGVPMRNDNFVSKASNSPFTIDYNNYRARLLTVEDINKVIDYPDFDYANGTPTKAWYYIENHIQTLPETYSGKYGWLYDRDGGDCEITGCAHNAETRNNAYAFWLADAVGGTSEVDSAWTLGRHGNVFYRIVSGTIHDGVRPVITIPKHVME